jgi:hypothetical protein
VPSGSKTTNLTSVLFNGGGKEKSQCGEALFNLTSMREAPASALAAGQYSV